MMDGQKRAIRVRENFIEVGRGEKRQAGRIDGSLKQSSNFVKTCAVVTNTAHLQPLFLLNVNHVGVPLESLVSYEQF